MEPNLSIVRVNPSFTCTCLLKRKIFMHFLFISIPVLMCFVLFKSFLARLGMSEKPVADFKPPQKHRKSGMNVASR